MLFIDVDLLKITRMYDRVMSALGMENQIEFALYQKGFMSGKKARWNLSGEPAGLYRPSVLLCKLLLQTLHRSGRYRSRCRMSPLRNDGENHLPVQIRK